MFYNIYIHLKDVSILLKIFWNKIVLNTKNVLQTSGL